MDTAITDRQSGRVSAERIPHFFYLCLLVLIWGRYFILDYAVAVFERIPLVVYFARWIIPGAVVVCVCFSFDYIKKVLSTADVFGMMLIAGVFLINLLLFEKNNEYLFAKTINIWLTIVPLYFVGLRFQAEDELKILLIVSILNIWFRLLYLMMFGTAMDEATSLYSGDMDSAYKILPHVCLVLMMAFKKPDLIRILTAAVGALYLVFCGTRGAMLCMLVFAVLYLAFFRRYKRRWLVYTGLVGMAALVYANFYGLMTFMAELAKKTHMSVRIFDIILNGEFGVSHGRDNIRETLVQAIKENPLLGYGIGGDYPIAGNYAHNIIIELWVSFGVVVGTMILVWLGWILLRGLIKAEAGDERVFILLMACSVIIKLMLSGTYLDETYLFLLIGLCVGAARRKKLPTMVQSHSMCRIFAKNHLYGG